MGTLRRDLVSLLSFGLIACQACADSTPTATPDGGATDATAMDANAADLNQQDTGVADVGADTGAVDTSVADAPPADGSGVCAVPAGASVSAALAALHACPGGLTTTLADDRAHRDLDVLFLVDNSPSMAPKQQALAAGIPAFFQAIEATGADYHVGVATSDVGTYTAPGTPWATSLGACNSFEGDDGTLQRAACTTRTTGTGLARTACASLCTDDSFVPAGGAGYIARVGGVSNVPVAMVGGVDVGPQRAFQCLALVGDGGCGVEGQFEGVKRALDGHNALNAGFLRASSLLAVVMITDEDDCSVSLAGRAENNPVTTDCPTPDANAAASCFNPDYRCIARDVVCDEPLNTPGAKHHCAERPASYLTPVAQYAAFLRSLRPASRVVLGGLWTMPDLRAGGAFNVVNAGGTPARSDGLNRSVDGDAACVSAADPSVVGRPQLRLSALAAQLPGSVESSVCDTTHYGDSITAIAQAITNRLTVACLDAPPRAGTDGAPLCVVGDVPAATPAAAPATALPACGAGCCAAWAAADHPTAADAGVRAACGAEAAACYCARASAHPTLCAGGVVAGVWRPGGAAAPDGVVTSFQCAR